MAITFVQGALDDSSPDTLSLSGVTSGNLIVICFALRAGLTPATITSITDNMGNAYFPVSSSRGTASSSNQMAAETWYCPNVIGGNLSISYTRANSFTLINKHIMEFAGADKIAPLRSGNNVTNGSGTPLGPSLTAVASTDLLVSAIASNSIATGVVSPWIPSDANNDGLPGAYYLPGTTGTFHLIGTTVQPYASTGAVFRASLGPISLVQSVSGDQLVNTQTITIAPTGVGNLIAVLLWSYGSGNHVTSMTDNVGNTYIQVPNAMSTAVGGIITFTDIWYAKNSLSGATTLTISYANAGAIFQVAEYSGVDTSSPIDDSGHLDNQTSTSIVLSPSLTTTINGDLLLSVIPNDTSNTEYPASVTLPWQLLANTYINRAYVVTDSELTGTYQASVTTSFGSANYCASAVAFKPFTGGFLTKSLNDTTTLSESSTSQYLLNLADSFTPTDTRVTFQFFQLLNDFVFKLEEFEGIITHRVVQDGISLMDWLSINRYPPKSPFGD